MKDIIKIIIILLTFWALLWSGCALSDECYADNTNNLTITL